MIHLDLPYNPNRLEQRNGRIDRYGQRNNPEIRYLFLAGTFEERLLLRLISKYEKARACLSFMPNTLGVGADPASLREPLFAGLKEDLFSSMPRLVHSLDLAAEDTQSDAYRDLLREIDRAFQSFDHMAVRHGWLSGGEARDLPPAETHSGIDLARFVQSVLTPEAEGYRVPPTWSQELDGLPGFDRAGGLVRLTFDPGQVRDPNGRLLMYPGRSHPLTRRAIASLRTGRVSAARGDTLSLLMTYGVEAGPLLRSVFALRLFPDGSITQQADFLSVPAEAVDPDGLWTGRFASWAPGAMTAASIPAADMADRIAGDAANAYRDKVEHEAATVRAWLARRALELCGPVRAPVDDLFSPQASDSWLSPEKRLAGFAADLTIPIAQRREAADALARAAIEHKPFPRPVFRTLGMLMIVP